MKTVHIIASNSITSSRANLIVYYGLIESITFRLIIAILFLADLVIIIIALVHGFQENRKLTNTI